MNSTYLNLTGISIFAPVYTFGPSVSGGLSLTSFGTSSVDWQKRSLDLYFWVLNMYNLADITGRVFYVRSHETAFRGFGKGCDEFTWARLKLRLSATWRGNLLEAAVTGDAGGRVESKAKLEANRKRLLEGFAAAPAVLKPKRLKVDKTRTLELFLDFTVCEGSSTLEDCVLVRFRLISLALDSISALLLFGDRRLERTTTFSISTILE
nr:hypothetical protein [Tanacetum cinerariifolium]